MTEVKEHKTLKSLLKPRKKGEDTKTILRVYVNKGEHLPAMDPTGLSDPFCKLRYEGKVQKTNIIKETLNPEWAESFDFEYKPDSSLTIDVYDWDFIGTNDFMGSVVINMSTVTHQYSEAWYTLKDDRGNSVPFARINVGVQMMTEAEAGIAPAGKNVSLMAAVVANLKPILNNIFRLLYIVVRPILLQLIVLRKLFIDWEQPTQTLLASVVFLYVWYYEYLITWILLSVWWAFTKRMWTYRFFGETYIAIDPDLKEKDMLRLFKDTKIELKYGKDDPISEDVQKVAKVTGGISKAVLDFQSFFNWQRKPVPTFAAWLGLLLFALFYPFVPWRFIFYWVFRVGLFVGWFAATILVPILRVFPTATTKIKRFFTARGFLSHIKPRYTTSEGQERYADLEKSDVQQITQLGVTEVVRANRVLTERGEWPDIFFYPVTAVLRTGHTTHVKHFIRPVNVLLSKFAVLNPGFDSHKYMMRHLQTVTTMEGGKVVIFDVNLLKTEFEENPNLAFHFYRWLAFQLTKKNDRSLTFKGQLQKNEPATDSSIIEDPLDPSEEVASTADILTKRAAERRKQMLQSLREKFGVSPEELVLHIGCDVFRKRRGKKFYGNVFVTLKHLAFLPATISQQNERWIADAGLVETAFVDKNGSLEIRFVEDEIRHLYHEDRNVLMEIVSHINHMKTAYQEEVGKKVLTSRPTAESPSASPSLKRHNIRDSLSRSLTKLQGASGRLSSAGSFRGSILRTSVQIPKGKLDSQNVDDESILGSTPPRSAELDELGSSPAPSAGLSPVASAPVAIDEDEDVEDVVLPEPGTESNTPLPEGVSPQWHYIRVSDVLGPAQLRKILDKRMRKNFAAGSEILPQDVTREVAVQILWKGQAKAVRKTAGKPDLFLGNVVEGSIFGETAYLLEAHAGASVVAVTDCIIYNLSGPWLDGLFDMDRLLGAQFFEMVCLILLERSVLTEEILFGKSSREEEDDLDKYEELAPTDM